MIGPLVSTLLKKWPGGCKFRDRLSKIFQGKSTDSATNIFSCLAISFELSSPMEMYTTALDIPYYLNGIDIGNNET